MEAEISVGKMAQKSMPVVRAELDEGALEKVEIEVYLDAVFMDHFL